MGPESKGKNQKMKDEKTEITEGQGEYTGGTVQ